MENCHFRIALYIDYIDSEYVQKVYSGAERFFSTKNVDLIGFSAGELQDRVSNSFNYQLLSVGAHLTSKNIDGIIFVTGTQLHHTTPEYAHSFLKAYQPIPVVSIGCPFDDIPSVMPDCTEAVNTLVTHLIKTHHCKRIALMGVAGHSEEAIQRTNAFCETLKQNNMPVDESLFMYGSFTYTSAMEAITKYAQKNTERNFDSIVALNDDMAYACIDFLRSKNVRVPQEVIVTGFDDLFRSSYTSPPLTSINQSIESQGFIAAKTVYDILCGKKPPLLNTVPAKPVFRQSCGCLNDEITSITPNGAVAEWCEKSAQFVQAIHLYSDMQHEVTIEEFKKNIAPQLRSMDIEKAAVCFYKTPISTDTFEYFPLPTEAFVLSAFDKQTGFELDVSTEPMKFNPREKMLPEGILHNLNGTFVMALYRNTIQYGYIIFKPGRYDMIVYNMVCKMFANALASAYSYTCAEEEKKELEKEYSIINRISLTDEMTGLLNRRGFISLGKKTLEVAEAIPQSGMVIY